MRRAHAIHLLLLLVLAGLTACSSRGFQPSSLLPSRLAKPLIVQNGKAPTDWVTLIPPDPVYDNLVIGSDKELYTLGASSVDKVDVASGQITSFPDPVEDAAHIGSGPDGNLWICGAGPTIASMTPQGVATTYDLGQSFECGAIIAGPDSNLWMTDTTNKRIARITTTGEATWFQLTSGRTPEGLTAGLDGFIYIAESYMFNRGAIGKLSTDLSYYREFTHRDPLTSGITTGSDGSIYAGANDGLYRLTSAGYFKLLPVGEPCGDNVAYNAPGPIIYIMTCDSAGDGAYAEYGVYIQQSTIITLPYESSGIPFGVTVGPDKNVWSVYGDFFVNILRILTVVPTSETISVGQQSSVNASETACRDCNLTATSSDPSIASVVKSGAGAFEITGKKTGKATVTVQDQVQNTFPIPVTVQ
jgi:hypothetical protein